MCRVLKVSSSGYYEWRGKPLCATKQANNVLKDQIKEVFEGEKKRSGAVRLTRLLRQTGVIAGKNRVAKIMRAHGWRARAARKFKATTNSAHSLPVFPNLLEQNFEASKMDEKWVSDITYIWTEEGWLYLAVVMDLYSRRILGWSLSERMHRKLVMDALMMAIWKRKMPRGVILHSDRGSQYCSEDYQDLVQKYGFLCSMSKRGDCFDNAAMESWNHSFKVEAIHGEKFQTRAKAIGHVFEYIEIYYNRKRLHSKLGYMTPESFESHKVA